MAYIIGQDKKDEQTQLTDPNAAGAQPATLQAPPTSSIPPPDTSQAPSLGGTAAPAAPKAPPRFNDISRLLYANQGQGKKIANNAIQSVTQKATDAQSQLQGAQAAYGAQAGAGAASFNPSPAPAPVVGGSGGLTAAGRQTTQLNTGPSLQEAQDIAQATYNGPASLATTTGVDAGKLQQSFASAEDAANSLPDLPGTSLLDSVLAQHEAGGDLRGTAKRFSGLQDQLNSALTDTSPADAARAATTKAAHGAQSYLDNAANVTAAHTAEQQTADNAATAAQANDQALFEQVLSTPAPLLNVRFQQGGAHFNGNMPNGFSSQQDWQNWFNNNKDEVRRIFGGG